MCQIFRTPDDIAGEVLTSKGSPARRFSDIHLRNAECRITHAFRQGHRARKVHRGIDTNPGTLQFGMEASCIICLQCQRRKTITRTKKIAVITRERMIRRHRQQFVIVIRKHHTVVFRSHCVAPAWGQRKAESAKIRLGLIQIGNGNDDVVDALKMSAHALIQP